MVRASVGRSVIFFAVCFGGVALPIAGGMIVALLGPPPYVLHEEALPSSPHRVDRFEDGSSVTVFSYADGPAARDAEAEVARVIPMRSVGRTESKSPHTRYTNAASGQSGLLLVVGRAIVVIEAPARAMVDRRVQSLSFVSKNPQTNPMVEIFDNHIGGVFLAIGIYFLLWSGFFLNAAPWAARIQPAPGTSPVTEEEMRRRLLQINGLGLPWRLHPLDGSSFRAEWVFADARWVEAISAGGLRKSHRLTLRLDPARRRVRVTESSTTVSGSIGMSGAFGSWSFSRGISFFDYERGLACGLTFHDGAWQLGVAYRFRFSASEMKNPLIEATVESGWTYAPVLTFVRFLGG
jgi:hypothetical protein